MLALALRIAPADRREWFTAMAAEFDHVPASARGRFALGCFVAAVRVRAISPQFVNAAARCLLIGGAVLWAGLNLRFAERMSVDGSLVPGVFGYGTALVFATGALATASYGYRATIALAAPLMAVLALAFVALRFGSAQAPLSKLYLALVVEDLVVLSIAVVVAAVAANRTRLSQEQA